MKKNLFVFVVLAVSSVAWAEGNGWRLTVGGRMRFGIDSSLRLNGGFVRSSAYATPSAPSSAEVLDKLKEDSATGTRIEFGDKDFIDFNDAAGIPGETVNWWIEDGASALKGTTLTFSAPYVDQTVLETHSALHAGEVDDYTAGASVDFVRTLWQNDRFGVDLSVGFSWFDDVDILKSSGCVYRRSVTETSGSINSSIQTSFDIDEPDILNPDGSIGCGNPYGPGPVLTVPGSSLTFNKMDGKVTVDTTELWMSARGKMSIIEAQLAVEPFVRVWDSLYLRGKVGVAMIATDVSIKGSVSENGRTMWSGSDDTHDLTFAGVLGLSAAYYFTDNFFVQGGVEMLLGVDETDIDGEFVNGSVGVGTFGCSVALGFAF